MNRHVSLLLLCLPLANCAAVAGFPKPIMTEQQENAEIKTYIDTSAVANFETCTDKILCRNTIIDARLRAVDLAFYRFQRKIYAQDSRVALGSDVISLGLASVASFTGAGGLAAGTGLLTGGRDAFQKQIRSVSLPLLFEQMTAKRREVLLRIRLGQRLPTTAYSLFQALDDVSEYELAGSIPAAAAELGSSVGQSARTSQIQLDALRATSLAAASAAVAAPVAAVSSAPQASSGTVVYSSTSGTASVATVVPDASSKTPPSPGSVIYTKQTGSGSAASIIPVPPAPASPSPQPEPAASPALAVPAASPPPAAPATSPPPATPSTSPPPPAPAASLPSPALGLNPAASPTSSSSKSAHPSAPPPPVSTSDD